MSEVTFAKALEMLSRDESPRRTPYDDATGKPIKAPVGHVTIGIGRNLEARPLSNQVMMMILREDVDEATRDARAVLGNETWESLTENRKLGFINLAFNLGRIGLQGFRKLIAATQAGDWLKAGEELRTSLWARQVDPMQIVNKGRDDRVIKLIRDDIYDY